MTTYILAFFDTLGFPFGEAVAAQRAVTDEGRYKPKRDTAQAKGRLPLGRCVAQRIESYIAAGGSYTIISEAVAAQRAVTDEGRNQPKRDTAQAKGRLPLRGSWLGVAETDEGRNQPQHGTAQA